MEMISEGYSLWLQPSGEQYNRFADLIKRLAQEYGGSVFEPHVTLLGGVPQSEGEAVRLTQQLVVGQKPFPITLGQVGFEDYHFRALFVRAEMTEPLLSLHERVKKLFGMQHVPPYMPHLSLLYGDYPAEVKEDIIATIGREQPAQFEVNSVHLIKGGEVEDWQTIREFSLTI